MDKTERKIFLGILFLAGIALGWWSKNHLLASGQPFSAMVDSESQKWVGTWVGGEVEFDISKNPANGTYQLYNRTFNFTCDITLEGDHAHWHGPPGSWVMDADLSADGKTAKAKGTDDQGGGLTKDFEFQKLARLPVSIPTR